MPLVLVHNDAVRNPAHVWDDVEGERYHYPAKYQSKIKNGENFVYYRGTLRADGTRSRAEYVGSGRIGTIWVDPNRAEGRSKAWYCSIEEYQRFAVPVPAKVHGVNLEHIPANLWRDGVRLLDPAVYERIMNSAGALLPFEASAISPSSATITTANNLILPPAPVASDGGTRSGYRKSKQAKAVGDWAETIVMRYLQEQVVGCSNCAHRAAAGQTPGWDIDYEDAAGELQRVEVKGTISGAFTSVDMTAGEMRGARTHRRNYWLYLVSNCLTTAPKVQPIQDPAEFIDKGVWDVTPAVFSIRLA